MGTKFILTEEERQKESKLLDNVKTIQDIWDYESVKEQLELQINLALNELNNK